MNKSLSDESKKFFQNSDFFAKIICVLHFLFFFQIHFWRYHYFQYADWDLAFFNQAMSQLLRGSQYVSLFEVNFFGNHSNFIAFLVLPLYRIFPHPLTLVTLKILSVSIGGYLLYFVSKEKLPFAIAILLMILYFLYLPNITGILYEFDFESLAPAFIFLVYIFYIKNRLFAFFICSFVLMSIKENMPLIIVAFGIIALIDKKPLKQKILWGAIPISVGILMFLFLTSFVIPHFAATQTHPYMAFYGHLGAQTSSGIIRGVLFNPQKVLLSLFEQRNLVFISNLFSPVLFLPFLNLKVLFFVSPIFLQHLLSSVGMQKSIFYAYALTLAPIIFLSLAMVLTMLFNVRKKIFKFIFMSLFIILFTISLINLSMHQNILSRRFFIFKTVEAHLHRFQKDFLQIIPFEASVVSTFNFLPALSNKPRIYSFHRFIDSAFPQRDTSYRLPHDVDYALIDFNNLILSVKSPEVAAPSIFRFFSENHWTPVKMADSTVLFQRNVKGRPLVKVESGQRLMADPEDLFILEKVWIDQEKSSFGENIFFHFQWQAAKDIHQEYFMLLSLQEGNKTVYKRDRIIGYLIYPTSVWRKADRIEEMYNFVLPELSSGDYRLEMRIFTPFSFKSSEGDEKIKTLVEFKI